MTPRSAPWAWAASSTTGTPSSSSGATGAGRPYRWTTTIARVRSVTAAAAAAGSMAAVDASTSTGTGTAPVAHTADAVGTAVNAGTMTSSPCADAESLEDELQRARPARHADGLAAERRGELVLERRQLGAEQHGAGAEDTRRRLGEARLEPAGSPLQVDDGDHERSR